MRLAVDVEERERDQVGEPVDRVADHLGVGDLGHPGPDPVDEGVLAGVDLVALGDHGLERGGGAQRGGDVLEARRPARRPGRPRGTGCATDVPLRTSSTPTPAGPPHLCAEPAATDQPSGSGSRPIEAQASMKTGATAAASATGWTVPTSWLACWSAMTSGPSEVARRSTRPSGSTRTGRGLARRCRHARACSTEECSTARVRHASRRDGASPSSPRCTASVPDEVNDTSSRRTPSASATASPGVVEDQPGVAGGGVQPARIGVPLVERGEHRVAGRGMQRLGGRGVDVHARKLPVRGNPPGRFRSAAVGLGSAVS